VGERCEKWESSASGNHVVIYVTARAHCGAISIGTSFDGEGSFSCKAVSVVRTPDSESSRVLRHAAGTTQTVTSYSAEVGFWPISEAGDDAVVVADPGVVIVCVAVMGLNVVICLVVAIRVLMGDNVDM
jgi:hypothetical protein